MPLTEWKKSKLGQRKDESPSRGYDDQLERAVHQKM